MTYRCCRIRDGVDKWIAAIAVLASYVTVERRRELIEYNFTQVLHWKATLTEMLTTLDFGFCVAELVFDWRNVNGIDRVVLTRVAYRKQTTIEQWTQADSTDGVVQRKSGGKTVSIPIENLIVLSH